MSDTKNPEDIPRRAPSDLGHYLQHASLHPLPVYFALDGSRLSPGNRHNDKHGLKGNISRELAWRDISKQQASPTLGRLRAWDRDAQLSPYAASRRAFHLQCSEDKPNVHALAREAGSAPCPAAPCLQVPAGPGSS